MSVNRYLPPSRTCDSFESNSPFINFRPLLMKTSLIEVLSCIIRKLYCTLTFFFCCSRRWFKFALIQLEENSGRWSWRGNHIKTKNLVEFLTREQDRRPFCRLKFFFFFKFVNFRCVNWVNLCLEQRHRSKTC